MGDQKIPKILLAEDDADIAATIVYALEKERYSVHHCTNGELAEGAWRDQHWDIAILDVGLPDQTGFELCRRLKSIAPDRAVMFLTAHSDEIDRIVGLELGAEDYLCKPFSPRELVLRIKTILRRQQAVISPHSPSVLLHDETKKLITFFNTALLLTKSEYLLLSAMLLQPGRVFTRDNLLDVLGDASGNASDRLIDTHIKEIRSKLREVNDCEVIITHRGLGYSLADVSLTP